MKFRVELIVKNRSGEIVPILYLKEGDRFSAGLAAMNALDVEDPEWYDVVEIKITAL